MREAVLIQTPLFQANRVVTTVAGFTVVVMMSGCLPPFSEMQGARLTAPGRVEATPWVSRTLFNADGETETLTDHVGIAVSTGLNERTEMRFRVERMIFPDGDGDGINVFGVGPKFALKPDRVALFVPIGFAFGSDIDVNETFQVHPTILFTNPLGGIGEFNMSAKAMIPIMNDGDMLVAATFGLALGRDVSRFAIRPEIGFLRNPSEEGTGISLGLGITFGSGTARARAP